MSITKGFCGSLEGVRETSRGVTIRGLDDKGKPLNIRLNTAAGTYCISKPKGRVTKPKKRSGNGKTAKKSKRKTAKKRSTCSCR
jgi:hypothetical protein